MSIHQVEGFYLHMESKKFNLDLAKALCDEDGLDFNNQGDYFVVEVFYSEDDAGSFVSKLNNKAGVKP